MSDPACLFLSLLKCPPERLQGDFCLGAPQALTYWLGQGPAMSPSAAAPWAGTACSALLSLLALALAVSPDLPLGRKPPALCASGLGPRWALPALGTAVHSDSCFDSTREEETRYYHLRVIILLNKRRKLSECETASSCMLAASKPVLALSLHHLLLPDR